MSAETLSSSLDTYLTSLGTELAPAEAPHVAALRLMASTLDSQDEPASSLLSAYARELARFQKGRASHAAPSDMARALADLAHETDHD